MYFVFSASRDPKPIKVAPPTRMKPPRKYSEEHTQSETGNPPPGPHRPVSLQKRLLWSLMKLIGNSWCSTEEGTYRKCCDELHPTTLFNGLRLFCVFFSGERRRRRGLCEESARDVRVSRVLLLARDSLSAISPHFPRSCLRLLFWRRQLIGFDILLVYHLFCFIVNHKGWKVVQGNVQGNAFKCRK